MLLSLAASDVILWQIDRRRALTSQIAALTLLRQAKYRMQPETESEQETREWEWQDPFWNHQNLLLAGVGHFPLLLKWLRFVYGLLPCVFTSQGSWVGIFSRTTHGCWVWGMWLARCAFFLSVCVSCANHSLGTMAQPRKAGTNPTLQPLPRKIQKH